MRWKSENGGKECKKKRALPQDLFSFTAFYAYIEEAISLEAYWDFLSFFEMAMVAELATKGVHHRDRIFILTLWGRYFVF